MKTHLQKLWCLNETIKSNMRDLENLRRLSESIGGSNFEERTKGGERKNKLQDCVIKIVDLEREIEQQVSEYVAYKRKLIKAIDLHKDEKERLLLRLRYIEYLTWEEISDKMNYSARQIYRLHKQALKNFEMR